MKRFALILATMAVVGSLQAQIPYFAGTVGDGKLYGYTSLKVRPGMNSQETYSTFQYGLGNYMAAGLDLYTANNSNYMGYLLRAGKKFSKWFALGGEVTPSFDLSDNFKFSYLTTGLYLNGAISSNERLFWCTNTWWGVNDRAPYTLANWEYLGYAIPLRNGHSITPMAGVLHSWKFDQDADIAAGFYYTVKNWTLYLWGNDFLKTHPRIIIGIEFIL